MVRLIVVRLWFWAAVLRPLKHVVPVPVLVRLVHPRRATAKHASGLAGRLDTLFRARRPFPRRSPGNCLERAFGAYRLLCLAGEHPELVIGMRPSEPAGQVEGHTWVVVDGRAIGEDDGALAGFIRMAAFDAGGRLTRDAVPGPVGGGLDVA